MKPSTEIPVPVLAILESGRISYFKPAAPGDGAGGLRNPLDSIMKKIFKIYIILIPSVFLLGFNVLTKDKYPIELIGTWEFVELLDDKLQHIDTLFEKDGFSVPQGPTWIVNSDKTYSRQFTPTGSIDNGTWTYNKRKKEIVLKLYWKKPYDDIAKYIMTLGYSKQDENGDYYDLIPQKIVEITTDKLVILEKENRRQVFKKVGK